MNAPIFQQPGQTAGQPTGRTGTCHSTYTAGCNRCQRAHRIKDGRRELRIAQGTWQPNEPAEPIQEHLANLRAARMSIIAISNASGVPKGTLYNIIQRRGGYVYGETAARIRAVVPVATPPAGFAPAVGPRRRAQGLACMGHSIRAQRARTGIGNAVYFRLISGRLTYISAGHAEAITAMCRDWADKRGPSKHAVTWAAKQGWVSLAAWDDIDDPNCQPDLDGASDPAAVSDLDVALVVEGKASYSALRTDAEKALAVAGMRAAGRSRSSIGAACRISYETVTKLEALAVRLAEREAVAA